MNGTLDRRAGDTRDARTTRTTSGRDASRDARRERGSAELDQVHAAFAPPGHSGNETRGDPPADPAQVAGTDLAQRRRRGRRDEQQTGRERHDDANAHLADPPCFASTVSRPAEARRDDESRDGTTSSRMPGRERYRRARGAPLHGLRGPRSADAAG